LNLERPRSEAGRDLSIDPNLSSRLLYLDVRSVSSTQGASVVLIFKFNTDEYADGGLGGFPAKMRRYLAEALGVKVTGDNFTATGGETSDF
jgi:hypothetical protein